MGTLQETFVLKVRDVLVYGGQRAEAETAGDLLIRRGVTVLLGEAGKKIDDLFLPPRDSHAGIVANKKRIAISILVPMTGGSRRRVSGLREAYCSRGGACRGAAASRSKGISETHGEDGEEGGVAQVVVVACDEGCKIFLEFGVMSDGLAPDRLGIRRIAGTAAETNLQVGLVYVIEARLDRDADVASGAWNDVSESKGEAGRDFAEVDASVAVYRIGGAADVVVAVKRYGAAGGNEGGCQNPVVIREDQQRAETEASVEWEPVERGMPGLHAEVDSYVGALLLEGGGVGEEVGTCAEIESSGKRRCDVEAFAAESCV
jgi:hypothetical protein